WIISMYNVCYFLFLCLSFLLSSLFFFFQAEDGIRDDLVTGVQTCALPIWTPMKCDGGPDPNVLDGPAGMTAAQQAAIPGCNSYWNPSAGRENPLYNDGNSSSPAYRPGGHWRVRNLTVGCAPAESILAWCP